MGPKKKGKGSKLARMSEEERMRYMQHRAAIEEEARRRKEQLIANFMKNKLKHEEAFMRLNSAKMNQQWRQILRKVKCKELKDDMKVLWTTFEAAVITKNNVIESLLGDLEDAEVQYAMMSQSHIQVVDRLIGLHEDRLASLHKTYTSEKDTLLALALKEQTATATESENACVFLQTVIFDMNSRNQAKHKSSSSAAVAKQDEHRNQMLSEIEKVEEQGSLQIEDMWRSIQQALKDYVTDTAPNRPHYNALRAKDSANTQQLLQHCETVNKYSDMIADLKYQSNNMQSSQTIKLKELKEELGDFMAQFDRLRQCVNYNQTRDQAKLTVLAVASGDVIKDLTKIAQKGEAILQLASTCQKYLTEKELLKNYKVANKQQEDDQTETDVPLGEMDNFWQQYSEVVLECEHLNAEKEAYSVENKQLRKILRHYLNMLARPTTVPRSSA